VSDRSLRFKLKWLIKAVTPPILVLGAKVLLIKLGLRQPDARPEAEPMPVEEREPEWEYAPEGWRRRESDPRLTGWDVAGVAEAYRSKWQSYRRALEGTAPLGIYHEVRAGEEVGTGDVAAHNMLVTFAYVLALAARSKERVSLLDWGGGTGHYALLAEKVLPGIELDYTCKEVPRIAAVARELGLRGRFFDDDSWRDRRYDLVMASGSLQYSEDWCGTLRDLGAAAENYLYVTRLPLALSVPSFTVIQRAYDYGYDTEYLGWVVNRSELLACAEGVNLELVREFLLDAWLSAKGAPEEPTGHRGFLFRPRG
jgi:putative methyltransferase (TIGR04325 family)